jgi:hypothetical protein
MSSTLPRALRFLAIVFTVLVGGLAVILSAQQPPPQRFGAAYAELDQRRAAAD